MRPRVFDVLPPAVRRLLAKFGGDLALDRFFDREDGAAPAFF